MSLKITNYKVFTCATNMTSSTGIMNKILYDILYMCV